MSRPRLYFKTTSATFSALEWAAIHYYADKHYKPVADIIRKLVRTYVDHDTGLDPDAFLSYAKKLARTEEDDELRAEMLSEAKAYHEQRKKKKMRKRL